MNNSQHQLDLLDSSNFVQDIEVYQHYEIARNDITDSKTSKKMSV